MGLLNAESFAGIGHAAGNGGDGIAIAAYGNGVADGILKACGFKSLVADCFKSFVENYLAQAAAMAESYGVTYNDLMEALKGTTGMIGAFGGKLKKKGGKHA